MEMETGTEEVTYVQTLRDIQGMGNSLKVNRARALEIRFFSIPKIEILVSRTVLEHIA